MGPIALRSELDLVPVFGERLMLRAPMLVEDWRVREESGTVLLRLSSQPREAARLWLEGERHAAFDLTIALAIIYIVLTLDALMSLGASTSGASAPGRRGAASIRAAGVAIGVPAAGLRSPFRSLVAIGR